MKKYPNFKYFYINKSLNDIPIFIEKVPSFLIFAKNAWDSPLVFDRHRKHLQEFNEVIEKRHKLLIDLDQNQNDFQNDIDMALSNDL